jgi:hypothetical protein
LKKKTIEFVDDEEFLKFLMSLVDAWIGFRHKQLGCSKDMTIKEIKAAFKDYNILSKNKRAFVRLIKHILKEKGD